MYLSVEQDKDEYYTVISMHASVPNEDSIYAWDALPIDDIKADMKAAADLFIDYANDNNLDNNYFLYVTSISPHFVYCYETDILYYPENLDVLVKMYTLFGTMFPDDLKENKEASEFLLANGFAHMQHERLEIDYFDNSYYVYINDGELQDFGFDGSLKH
jgi:hypothetical protein